MKHVLLFSGGIDSFVAYYYLKDKGLDVETVYFDLGTPYTNRELAVVKKLIPETIIDRSICVGNTQRGVNAFLPYRNLLLTCGAAKYGRNIFIAGLKDDCVEDKNPMAFDCMEECLNFISKSEDAIKLSSPFWEMTKQDVVFWWRDNAVRIGRDKNEILETISCYDEAEPTNYCGRCPSCLRKFFALRSNGFDIEFYNEKLFQEYIKRAEERKYDESRSESILSQKDYECKRIYCFDIDGTLTIETKGHDYKNRTPNLKNIQVLCGLHSTGNKIVLFTSRFGTEEDKLITEEWMKKNNVKYDAIIYGKPYYDYCFDDKNLFVGGDVNE